MVTKWALVRGAYREVGSGARKREVWGGGWRGKGDLSMGGEREKVTGDLVHYLR